MTRRLAERVFLPFMLLAASVAAAPAVAKCQSAPTVVILVRHAEKMAEPAGDPPLSPAGEQRARDLVAALRDQHLDAIITTQYVRTKETAAPIATELHIIPEVVSSVAGQNHAQAVADAIRKHAGQTVLVVGHSNSVPQIIAALGAPSVGVICDSSYDQLFVVTMSAAGPPSLLRARYGTPTPSDQGCPTMK
jgi:phosphohistidine phosphatase SixA